MLNGRRETPAYKTPRCPQPSYDFGHCKSCYHLTMVDGTSMTFSVVSSPMELLPTEIKIEVLRHCPNTRSLRALTRASGLYFHAYVSTSSKIFTEVLLNEIATVGHSLENKSFFEFDSRHFTHEPHQQQHLESRYHRYRSLGWGLPSIRDSLALPVVSESDFSYVPQPSCGCRACLNSDAFQA